MERREFEMSESDLSAILEACKATPVMYLPGGQPMYPSPEENANRAWRELGGRLGFAWATVRPVVGKGDRFFTAEEVEESG